jgi:hypothetical protein
MAYLAGAGFPVPRVHDASGPDLVLERLGGRDMLADLSGGVQGGRRQTRPRQAVRARLCHFAVRRSRSRSSAARRGRSVTTTATRGSASQRVIALSLLTVQIIVLIPAR